MDIKPGRAEFEAPTLIVNKPSTFITKECRYGTFSWSQNDEFVGRALNDYGEYSEGEVEMLRQILRPGDIAIDVGANIGALTIPMAQMVGPEGAVYAFEPGQNNWQVLHKNITNNDLHNVIPILAGASDKAGEVTVVPVASANLWRRPEPDLTALGPEVKVPVQTIDSLNLQKCKFVKIDVDGMELETIAGMDATIKRCRPYIYIENEQKGKQAELIEALTDRGYRLWWHRPYQFNPNNFRGNKRNWFGNIVSIMMIACPEEGGPMVDGLDEAGDVRDDDDMFEREIWRYERYVKRDHKDLVARNMLAHNLNLAQRFDEAQTTIDDTLKIAPEDVPTIALRGLMDLQRGNYKRGWPAFELRFKQRNTRNFGGHRKFDVPKWNGEMTHDKVLIWSEQGFGDMIMFARFIPWVLERAPNAIFEVHSYLHELMCQSFRYVPFSVLHRKPHHFDAHCSLPSVGAAFDVTVEDIEKYSKPYISADDGLVRTWRERGNPSNIGICHKGSPRSERPLTRDIPAHFFDPLNAKYSPFFMLHQEGQFENFADTAASIAVLDLVITVDTSIAHLAGAMGKPVWLLLSTDPDWRWGLQGNSTLWYPSMRIFRQKKFRDWAGVIQDVIEALDEREALKQAAQ